MKRWKPAKNTHYWIVSTSHGGLSAQEMSWDNDNIDKRLYDTYNCFKTQDAAEAAIKAVQKTLKDIVIGRRAEEKSKDTECPAEKDTKKQDPHKVSQEVKVDAIKLTPEIFYHPDCPPWANFASVSSAGRVLFHADRDSPGAESYIGVFDNTDWENSMIEKPTKVQDPKKILEIKDTVFNQTFLIYIGHTFLEYYKEVTGDDYVGDDNVIKGYSINTDRAEICIWIASTNDIPSLVHELQHAVQYALYSRCGVNRNENELPAYYMEFLVRETLELLRVDKDYSR